MTYKFFNPEANREALEAEAARQEQRHYELTTGNFDHDTSKEAEAALAKAKAITAEIEKLPAPPTPEEIAKQEVLDAKEFDALKTIAAQELEKAIENTEGDNDNPATILAAIESLRP